MNRFPKVFSRLLGLVSLALLFASASPALADGTYCWCRNDTSGVCSNFRANQVVGGTASAGDSFTDAQCNSYCSSHGSHATNVDTTYRATEICATGSSAGCTPNQGSCVGIGASETTPTTEPTANAPANTASIELYNPLGANTDIPAFIGRGIRGVLGLIGGVALLMFVYGGIVWMTAGGDSKRVEGAKSIIKNSVIGLLLIFFSYNLIGVFFSFFTGR
jgi:hypothetical protein